MRFQLKQVIIDPTLLKIPFTKKVLDNLRQFQPGANVSTSLTTLKNQAKALDKALLYIHANRGDLLKPCPGTIEHICCGYQILNIGTGCPMDCSYCILQSYFNEPGLRVMGNLEEGLRVVLRKIDSQPKRIFRVGTGEFTDSLAFDPIAGWTELLTPHFSKRKNVVLELKTKTDHVQGLIRSKFRERIIVSWSLNSPTICSRDEKGTASLQKRLEAARLCQKEGFAIGLHFDPIIYYSGWKEDYLKTLDLLDKHLEPKRIIWVSLGAFRYMPSLKQIIRTRHPSSFILNGEFVTGKDGKMRYFKPIRVELYSFIKEKLETWSQDLGLYMCMESDDVWRQTFGWSPGDTVGLSTYLDDRVRKIFG